MGDQYAAYAGAGVPHYSAYSPQVSGGGAEEALGGYSGAGVAAVDVTLRGGGYVGMPGGGALGRIRRHAGYGLRSSCWISISTVWCTGRL